MPRDDRAISRTSLVMAGVFILGFLGAAGALVATSSPHADPLFVAACFALVAGAQLWSLVRGIPDWLAGRPVPGRKQVVQIGIFFGSFAFFLLGSRPGLAAVLGALTGMFAMAPISLVLARRNRAVVDAAWASRSKSKSKSSASSRDPLRSRRTNGQRPRIGHTLAMSLAWARARATAWAVATVVGCVVAIVGAARLDRDEGAFVVTLLVGLFCVGFPLREAWGVHRARRAYDSGRRTPRVGWVTLLHDPNPRVYRPLLAIWDEEPISGPGTFPKPDRVFRADDENDALLSFQSGMTVHEAWIDGVEGRWATPRWVAADDGLAIPHRRALLGRWYFAAITSSERADAEPLTLGLPDRQHEAVDLVGPSTIPGANAIAWRSGVLSVFALVWILLHGS